MDSDLNDRFRKTAIFCVAVIISVLAIIPAVAHKEAAGGREQDDHAY
jgi:hypothetical protein